MNSAKHISKVDDLLRYALIWEDREE
jgi:hypothetical protein